MRNPILNLTRFSLLGLLLALGTALADDIQKANARLGVGVNFGNALDAPREGEWGVVLEEEFFDLAKEAGFESIRLPVRWTTHAQAEVPYTIDPDFFRTGGLGRRSSHASGIKHHHRWPPPNRVQRKPRGTTG